MDSPPAKTYSSSFNAQPIRQKVYLFSQLLHKSRQVASSPSHRTTCHFFRHSDPVPSPESPSSQWKPKLPSKKLFEDPKFFISLERKKTRIINGIKNAGLSEMNDSGKCLRGGKLRNVTFLKADYLRKYSLDRKETHFEDLSSRKLKERKTKTPYLNFNMQYLIKKRKSFTTSNLFENTRGEPVGAQG